MAERARSAGPDTLLLAAVASLCAIGLVMVFSASSVEAVALHHDATYFLKRQAVWLIVGIGFALLAYRANARTLRAMALPALVVSLALLVAVRVPHIGVIAGGARRWIGVGPFGFEPSEIAKVGLVLYLSAALAGKGERVRHFSTGLAPLLIWTFALAGLVVVQPDFGTASLLVMTAFVMLYVAGARVAHLAFVLACVAPFGWFMVRHDPYKWARITAFVNPWADPRDKGYHIVQSLMALGSGGWFGVGLGFSHQKYFYLPESYTDFIAAIIGEELGLLGLGVIVALFVFFAWRATRIALRAPDRFGFLLAVGSTASIVVQAFVNLGVITSTWPVTGVPLPFISFGGTSLVTTLVLCGFVANVGRGRGLPHEREARVPERRAHPIALAR